jgi:hypothetical protein
MTTYEPDATRRILKTEQADFVKSAIERAKNAPAQHEGSLTPTGRTIFYFSHMHEALQRWAELSATGWTLDTQVPALLVAPQVPLSFTAICPNNVFESYFPLIAERAEKDYVKQVEEHNKQAAKLKEREAFIESEFQRLEQERLAQLRADLAAQYDARSNGPREFFNHNDDSVKLHA